MEVRFITNNYANSYNNKRVRAGKSYNGLDILGSSSPEEVKDAWNKAEKTSGVNGYGMNSEGKLTQLTTLFAMSLESRYNGGGQDILGIYMTKRFPGFSVGKVGLLINFFVYGVCLILFDIEIVIYSLIYCIFGEGNGSKSA